MPVQERRQHRRHPMAVGVQIRHEASQKDYPARSIDLSKGGMLLLASLTAPLSPGHRVELHFKDQILPSIRGTVVRVNRGQVVTTGQLSVGVQFDV